MSTTFNVTIRATSITVYPGQESMTLLQPLIDLLTYEDEFVEETKTLGYMYDADTDTLYLHKGIDPNYLKRLLINVEFSYDLYHEYRKMNFDYDEIIAPRNDEQVDVINFIAGLNQHSSNIDESQLFLVRRPGFGKCEPYSNKIPTPTCDGYTLMGDIKLGDYVFGKDGYLTKVIQIFEQGEKDVYEVEFSDGRIARCGLEHLWNVKKENGVEWVTRTLQEIIKDFDNSTYYIPLCEPIKCQHINIDKDVRCITNNGKVPSGTIKPYIDDDINCIKNTLYYLGYAVYCENDNEINYTKTNNLRITDIRFSHKEQCRCSMVDNSDHLYLTENFIVTHNTYCSGVGSCLHKTKTLIVMHRTSLRNQWIDSLYNMSGLSNREVHEIKDSEEVYKIAYNEHDFDYDVYLLTHATFRAGLKRINSIEVAKNITKNLGIGMKIIDEDHLEFRDTLLMDFIFNVQRNLYLTATDGRSAKEENSIFHHVFANALYYKPSTLLTDNAPKKWVEYVTVRLNTGCKANIYKYRVAGGRGMNPASYGKWVIAYDKKQRHFKCCRDLLKIIYERDSHAKVLLFMPLIDLCSECAYFLSKELNYDKTFDYDLDIRTINSQNSKNDNERNKRADVIVTTIQSAGTGTDIPGITDIISCSPYVSKITARQVFGRIRYCGKVCHYYDIYDESVLMDRIWIKSRSKCLKHIALNTSDIVWEDEEEQKETNG